MEAALLQPKMEKKEGLFYSWFGISTEVPPVIRSKAIGTYSTN